MLVLSFICFLFASVLVFTLQVEMASAATPSQWVLGESINSFNQGPYQPDAAIHDDDLSSRSIDLVVHVKQHTSQLEQILLDISTPGSPHYGKHMSKQEVDALTNNDKGKQMVREYLEAQTGLVIKAAHGHAFTVTGTVAVWAAALNTTFAEYYDPTNAGKPRLIRTTQYFLPSEVAEQVALIENTVQFPTLMHRGPVVMPHKG